MKKIIISMAAVLLFCHPIKANEADTYISDVAQQACIDYGEEYGICPELIMAMVEKESSGKPNAKNGDCIGLMQISEKWHKDRIERLGVTDLTDEVGNIRVGVDYLAELIEQNGEEVSYILDLYNGNSKAKSNYENRKISSYASYILMRSAELERMHGK